ncbi:aldehyde dehydrogenase family protein [Paraburkholderia sp. HD33-4]|uniref:aldehyde dehydrogenase family protein n=1 Tax=Paraburkholderia sp. HD33-4 TaxID=2883242 RepID=UPI001F1EC59F|nr:aldehyde dehydrogenase family protein [Paraburkholderia sp. HD33-4]
MNPQAARTYGHHIAGEIVSSDSVIQRVAPGSGQGVATFAEGTQLDAQRAIEAARRAFDTGGWPQRGGIDRARLLNCWADLIEADKERLARIDAEEVGKPIRFARGDLEGVVTLTRYAASLALQIHGETFTDAGPSKMGLVLREPVGVAGLIVPWNFPALIFSQKVPFALAAGCTVVVKPSEFTSGSALELVRLAEKAGIPAGVINVVTGYGNPVAETIVTSPDVDIVSFTGSTETGRKVIRNSADTIKRVAVELGGKAANIVFDDADLDAAVDGVVFGIFFNNGECCVSHPRLLVQDTIADEFVRRVTEATRRLVFGDPLDDATDVGPLIHPGHYQKVESLVRQGIEEGATVMTGGVPAEGNGSYFPPTVLEGVGRNATLFREEIFGPVLTVTRFRSLDEAVELANSTQYGLGNSVWSKDIDRCMSVGRKLKSGVVFVNTTIDGQPQYPFGGYKQSGYGREMGKYGLEEYTAVKTLSIHLGAREKVMSK